MLDIGAQLRETRMRRRIDISEVEAATKIRAKYLRALENEEWSLLPGPTFVKTFLRTYAEYLDLDARSMVEEYRQRYERPATTELTPFGPGMGGRPPRRRRPVLGPWVLVAGVFVGLIAALYVLGTSGGGGEPMPNQTGQRQATATPSATPRPRKSSSKARRRAATSRTLRFGIEATGTVWVCLEDGNGKPLVDQRTMQAGERTRTFRGRHFVVAFGNGAARMRINGRSVQVPSRGDAVGYDLRAGRRPRELPSGRRPTCT